MKKGISFVLLVTFLLAISSVFAATNPATTWYLFNTTVSGVTPAGQILQSANSTTTGWQPTKLITTTAAYWYSDTQTGTYNAGNWQFILWTGSPASSSVVQVEIYKTNADGSGAALIGGQQVDVKTTGGGNHPSTYTYSGAAAVALSGQRLMVKIYKVSGVDVTMAYNTNDFPTRLLTPPIGTGPTPTLTATPTPVVTPSPTPASRSAFSQIEAESYTSQSGIQTEATGDTGGGLDIGWIENGDYAVYSNIDFGTGANSFNVRVASATTGGNIEIRLDSLTGTLVGTCAIAGTGGWQTWVTKSCSISGASGLHNLYLRFTGGGGSLFNINWFVFVTGNPPTPTPTPNPSITPTVTPTVTPTLTPTVGPTVTPGSVDFGPNVHIYDPGMSMTTIQSEIDAIYNAQQNNHFGDRRDAILLKPGTYSINVGVGFYTEVMGLGANPDATTTNGVYSVAYLGGNNATQNFWRGVTNFKVNSTSSQWAVSQAIWFRQMHVTGRLQLHQGYGWASGGWIANSKIDGQCEWGSQQQFIIRNSQSGSYAGGAWNFVYVGVPGAPATTFPSPPNTTIATVPVVREKPFLMFDGSSWSVRVPSLKTNSSGYDWGGGSVPGTTLPISQFYIARSDRDTAATINAQLAAGKNLILTPGIYNLDQTIQITRANTIVLGMGLATLRPSNGAVSMSVADVDGVTIAGVLFDAGPVNSAVQLRVGTAGNTTSHASNPIVLQDVIFRVGGAFAGKTTTSMEINAYDTIVDHTWVWRADHGSGVGWTSNTANNGVIVNGNNVICYGLFVEHYQQYQVLWNGNGGRVYFYQSEDPYDPPNQASWTSGAGVNGWASYKVASNVTSHEAWGLGVYSVFTNTGVNQTRAIEVPVNSNVKFHSLVIENLANGTIQYVINNTAGPTVVNFP